MPHSTVVTYLPDALQQPFALIAQTVSMGVRSNQNFCPSVDFKNPAMNTISTTADVCPVKAASQALSTIDERCGPGGSGH